MAAVTSSGSAKVTLPTDEQILITREFDAPKHLVYKAWTTPELVERWWSGHRGKVTLAEIDLRVGGLWRYVMEADGGFEVGFHGEFREIVPNERIVSTEVYEGFPDGEALNTLTLTEVNGRTTSPFSCSTQARSTATRTSTPAWRPACRSPWTSWSRWRSPCAERRTRQRISGTAGLSGSFLARSASAGPVAPFGATNESPGLLRVAGPMNIRVRSDTVSSAGRAAYDARASPRCWAAISTAASPCTSSLSEVSDSSERSRVLNRAWRRYGWVNSCRFWRSSAAGPGPERTRLAPSDLSPRERSLARAKDVAVGAVAATGLATAVEGIRPRQAPQGAVPLQDGDHPSSETPERAARLKRRIAVLSTAGAVSSSPSWE